MTPELLTAFETCARKGAWSRNWESPKLTSTQMLSRALRPSLEAIEGVWGEIAGAEILQLATDRGLDTDVTDVYGSVMHLASLADILVSAIRKPSDPPWQTPEPSQNWTSGCYLVGDHLRRIVLVSNWNDERHYSECRSWFTLGECAHYELPMQMVVMVIGQQRNGRRHGPWTQGFLHPQNRVLRFRKKSRSTSEVFNDKWEKVYREDHAEISREKWLQSMLTDDVLPEVLFRVDIPVPAKSQIDRIREMAARKMDRLLNLKRIPEANLSTCDRPPCPFRRLCHVVPEKEPSEKTGYLRII